MEFTYHDLRAIYAEFVQVDNDVEMSQAPNQNQEDEKIGIQSSTLVSTRNQKEEEIGIQPSILVSTQNQKEEEIKTQPTLVSTQNEEQENRQESQPVLVNSPLNGTTAEETTSVVEEVISQGIIEPIKETRENKKRKHEEVEDPQTEPTTLLSLQEVKIITAFREAKELKKELGDDFSVLVSFMKELDFEDIPNFIKILKELEKAGVLPSLLNYIPELLQQMPNGKFLTSPFLLSFIETLECSKNASV